MTLTLFSPCDYTQILKTSRSSVANTKTSEKYANGIWLFGLKGQQGSDVLGGRRRATGTACRGVLERSGSGKISVGRQASLGAVSSETTGIPLLVCKGSRHVETGQTRNNPIAKLFRITG